MFEAAIFDWDGTLADTRRAIVVSFQKALKEIQLEVPISYIERRIGIGAAETFREVLQAANRKVNEKVVKQLVEHKSKFQIQLADEVALFEGARELLDALHGKVKVGLASMNSRPVIMDLLRAKGLADCFDAVLTVEAVSHSKPDPEIFLKTAQQLKAPPERCVVLEDSLFGVKAAKAAGMSCVAVTTGVYSKIELEKENPDLIVESLKNPTILPFILGK
ncbi:MAG: HAD family phosphatase [Candidatus Bathyarchaeota archaeon]|nr:HAD family phosphatase [Candidatus Bathyarchaeota archaeon]